MPQRGWMNGIGLVVAVHCLFTGGGCTSTPQRYEYQPNINQPRTIEADQNKNTQNPKPPSNVPAKLVEPKSTLSAEAIAEILDQIVDPRHEIERINREMAKPDLESLDKWKYQRELLHLNSIKRPKQIPLKLSEVIHKTLQNNYIIQTKAYNPAIEATNIVEAEAQFDAVFFANITHDKQDRPTSSQLFGTETDNRILESGVRKLLSTGANVRASYSMTRTKSNLVFQTLNPSYFNNFMFELRQPFLRGFGTDYTRAQIELSILDRHTSVQDLKNEIENTLFEAEKAYWVLSHDRRTITLLAKLLSELELLHHYLEQRYKAGYDVYYVQLNLARSRLATWMAEFATMQNVVKNSEEVLKVLMNDPDLNLARYDIEIIPTDTPTIEPTTLDEYGEVADALANRPDLHQARLDIDKAKLAIGVAKNQALPRLDATFRYIIDGLGGNWHAAFSQASEMDFEEYYTGLQFEWPIGNRGPEAALKRARLQEAQAIARHRSTIEGVIFEVKTTILRLQNAYQQIDTRLEQVRALEGEVRAIQDRQERRDPPALDLEINAHEQLLSARRSLLDAVIADFPESSGSFKGYNVRLVELEKKKGTLLRYNNIVIKGQLDQYYSDPYRPLVP
ncbi:MAG: TolC family protein [Planctomycetota bacterium]